MLRFTTLALALVLSASAHAQPLDPPLELSQLRSDPSLATLSVAAESQVRLAESLRDDHKQALVIRNVGIGLAVVGTIATVAGTFLFLKNLCIDDCSNEPDTTTTPGAALLAVGQVAVLAGIPMWAVGQSRATKSERALLQLSASGARLTF